jgi:hypothetical protein
MASAVERIKARRERLSKGGRAHLDVVEWGDEGGPLRVFWQPVTPLDVSKSRLDQGRGNAELVALKAEDEGGNRMFPELGDADVLYTQADAVVVQRIAIAMLAAPSIVEAVKN